MGFRERLTLFFMLMVIVPVAAVTLVVLLAIDSDERWVVGAILLGFFVLAAGFAVAAFRSLQRQIDGLLEERLGQLRRERDRAGRSIMRLGDAVASSLDRDGLLGIVVETAVEGAGAEGGRAIACRSPGGELDERVQVGRIAGLEQVLGDVETEALDAGAPADLARDDLSALAHPLRSGDGREVVGVVSVARRGQPFSPADRELFAYLAGQAAVSLANVGLHETAQRQATIDALTGLNTRRRFDEALAAEVERARRYPDRGLSLVLLDLDDFKAVNDTYCHQVGDEVLRQVARIVRESSRESDAPSRYGGEELAVVLPGTDLQGAFEMAERVRSGVETLAISVDGDQVLRVTASLGVATLPVADGDASALILAADQALYEAKRAGKNRTVRAE